MIIAIRRSPTALTLLCLAGITAMPTIVILLLDITDSSRPPLNPLKEMASILMVGLLFWPLAWWLVANIGGGLWNMNDGITWKALVCVGGLAIVVVALLYDLVMLALVQRFYIGHKALKGTIIGEIQPAKEPGSSAQA